MSEFAKPLGAVVTEQKLPEWFLLGEQVTPLIMQRIADAVTANQMCPQVKHIPMLAHWFISDSLLLANRANRDGMHANAISLLRQCVEGISVIELGICGNLDAESKLLKWEDDGITAGQLRRWLQDNVWIHYGVGLWNESWHVFMREFAAAVQPYAHYGSSLAQWQIRLHGFSEETTEKGVIERGVIEICPRAYDPQKATRITLFHSIILYIMGRIWMAQNQRDSEFISLINNLGAALGKSRYLDGHSTDWSQQFWAMMWNRNGGTILE